MNQQINLYLPEFRKEKDHMSVGNMALIVCAFVAVLAIVTAVDMFSGRGLRQEVAEQQALLDDARASTNALIDRYGAQGEDSQLASEVRTLEENLQGKRALLGFLDGRDIGNTGGFSEYLADLSRFHVQGLRLTSISLTGGGSHVVLGGEVTRAENVPLYLQSLRNGASYNGKTFETLSISDASDEDSLDTRMAFDVATTGSVQP